MTSPSAVDLSFLDEPGGDATRRAIASLRGYTYQLYASAIAWLELEDGDSLWLEVAEDYATVAQNAIRAVQVKDTAASGTVTLRSQAVRKAIDGFVDLVERNKDKRVTLRFLTTSPVGMEQKLTDRPDGVEGLTYWRKAASDAPVTPLRDILLAEGTLSSRARAFVSARDDEALRADLLRNIHWDCGTGNIDELHQVLETRLIHFGFNESRLPAAEGTRLVQSVIVKVLQTTITGAPRCLKKADLPVLIDAATRISLPRRDVDRLLALGRKAGDWLQPLELVASLPGIVDEMTVAARRDALGREPSWRLLRKGVYCPRPDKLREAIDRLDTWLGKCWFDNTRLPAFWIDGRSGDGKSILLLQLVAEFVSRNSNIHVALCSPAQLLDRIESGEPLAEPVLFVVDDLHKALALDDFNGRLARLLDSDIGRVGILACGPSPELDRFSGVCRDTITIEKWTMLAVDDDERRAFISWLQFTDQGANLQSDLLVEFLFELKVGEPLVAFARNFRHRLDSKGTFEPVKRVLAVNTLDLAADPSLVPSGDSMKWLQRLADKDQGHFDLDAKMLSGASGIKFAHSRIAWRLFVEWTHEAMLRTPLNDSLAEALAPGLLAVADRLIDMSAILQAAYSRYPSLLQESNREGSAIGLLENLARRVKSHDDVEVSVMSGLAVLRTQQSVGPLPADLLTRARLLLRQSDGPSARKCSLAAKLLYMSCRDRVPERHDIVHDVLHVLFDREQQDYAGTEVVYLATRKDGMKEEWTKWPRDFLNCFPDASSLPLVIQWLARDDQFDQNLIAPSLVWLGDPPKDRPGADRVLTALLAVLDKITEAERSRVVKQALDWFGDPPKDHPGAHQVLAALLAILDKINEAERSRVVNQALNSYCHPQTDRPGAHHVLTALLAVLDKINEAERSRVVNQALGLYCDPQKDRSGGHQVLAVLLAMLGAIGEAERPGIVNRVLDWLGEPPKDRPGAHEVIKSLLSVLEKMGEAERSRVVKQALDWFDAFGHRDGAEQVARLLCYTAKNANDITNRLLIWVSQRRSDKQRRTFVEGFLSIVGAHPHIRKIAEELWEGEDKANFRAPILMGLISAYPNDSAVVSRVVAHLRLERAPFGARICQRWLEKTSDPVSVIEVLLSPPDVLGGGSQKILLSAVEVAFARAVETVFAAMPRLLPKHRSKAIHLLRKGIRRRTVDGAAQALLDRIDAWPEAYVGILFRALLESPLETPSFAARLFSWLNQERSRDPRGVREVILGLADSPQREAQLTEYLTTALKSEIEKERNGRVTLSASKRNQSSIPNTGVSHQKVQK
ncbi:hypothetical protein IFT66_22945 [Rhizobium sp. CFBP 13726]|uniref:hypothetical protein n=1 Tax=Rhizobium sp. CFBP 13726 TaxID=2775296 RepID=UPI001783850E|nr:hypothetical protein [Rhizobium sp. CFBP 13726]MBD8653948.1 hypothetical protein [Rhizobium sp. CFBP 13726]